MKEDDNWKDFMTKEDDFYSLSEAFVDENAKELKEGDIIQLERKEYYRVNEECAGAGKLMVLFNIPAGKASK